MLILMMIFRPINDARGDKHMRILHTADWHLTETLKLVDRHPHIVARLEEIAGLLEEHQVDVMIVAGDMFSQCTRMDDLNRAMADVNRVFKPFLLRGGTMIAISGNHDNEDFFAMLRNAIDLATPIDPRQTGPRPGGRLYIAAQPTILELADKAKQSIQFALLPYPTSRRYLRNDEINYRSLAEKNRRLHDALIKRLNVMMNGRTNPALYSVLVAHIHVRGSQLHNLYHASEKDDIIFQEGELPTHWEYMALGHIHKPQAIEGIPYARYAGSPERLNKGERDDEKGVVLVEIGPQGRRGDPVCLPLKATPFYHLEILDPDTDLQGLCERYPEHARALVSYRLVYKPGEHDPRRIAQELQAIFPNIYDWREEREGLLPGASGIEGETSDTLRDAPTVIENYIQERLADHPDKEAVLALMQELLATVE
jgi:exonuclease SbcD